MLIIDIYLIMRILFHKMNRNMAKPEPRRNKMKKYV